MLHVPSALLQRLQEQIDRMPVIDCHEHLTGPEARPPYKEPIAALAQGYVVSDLQSRHWASPTVSWAGCRTRSCPPMRNGRCSSGSGGPQSIPPTHG